MTRGTILILSGTLPACDLSMAFLFVSMADTHSHATKEIHVLSKRAIRYVSSMGLIELHHHRHHVELQAITLWTAYKWSHFILLILV